MYNIITPTKYGIYRYNAANTPVDDEVLNSFKVYVIKNKKMRVVYIRKFYKKFLRKIILPRY